jgi:transcription initiation factor TFIIB
MLQEQSRPLESTASDAQRATTSSRGPADAQYVCPECSSPLPNREHERVCPECHLVVEDLPLDRGPEWRVFDDDRGEGKRRTGPARTVLLHDDGLSTNISWRDKDAQGRQLSAAERRRMARLRKQDRWSKFTRADRNRADGLGEIRRMASSLELGDDVQETAAVLFRRAQDEDLLRGRSIESVATAALLAAGRMHGRPQLLRELVAVSRLVNRDRIFRAYRTLTREFDLAIQLMHPRDLVPKFVTELGVFDTEAEQQIENAATRLARQAVDEGIGTGGTSPSTVAASAVYVAGAQSSLRVTQRVVAEVATISAVSIQNTYPDILEASPSVTVSQDSFQSCNAGPRTGNRSHATQPCPSCGTQFDTETGLTLHRESCESGE